jgi:hypothetical protein
MGSLLTPLRAGTINSCANYDRLHNILDIFSRSSQLDLLDLHRGPGSRYMLR